MVLLKVTGDIEVTGDAVLKSITLDGTAVTASAGDINKLIGLTSTASELNILHGVTVPKMKLMY